MIQTFLVGLIFVAAAAYLGWVVVRSFRAKSCATGCGKCGVTLDVDKVVKEVRKREVFWP